MHGAALLYNLALSELRENDDWVAHYHERMHEWAEELDLSAVRSWSLEDFWDTVAHPAHTIQPMAKRFVTEWRELVIAGAGQVQASSTARDLLRERRSEEPTAELQYPMRHSYSVFCL